MAWPDNSDSLCRPGSATEVMPSLTVMCVWRLALAEWAATLDAAPQGKEPESRATRTDSTDDGGHQI